MSLRHVCIAVVGLSPLLAAAPQDPELKNPLTGDKLTVSEVEARIGKLKEDKALQEAAKAPLQTAYGDALAALQAAIKSEGTQGKLTALKNNAAQQRQGLKQQLASAVTTPMKQALDSRSTDELAVGLQQAQTAAGAAARKLSLLDDEIRARAERQKTLPQEIVRAEATVRQADERVQTAKGIDDPLHAAAQQTLAAARQRQAKAELEALKAELDTFGLASELLTLERELAQKQEREAREKAEVFGEAVRARQQAEAAQAAKDATKLARLSKNEVLRKAGETATEYASRLEALSQKLADADRELGYLRRERERVEKSFKDSQSNIRKWGLSELLGDSLRRERAELPSASAYRLKRQQWTAENRRLFSALEKLSKTDKAEFVARVLRAAHPTGEQQEILRADAQEVFDRRQFALDRFGRTANELSQKLLELDTASRSLLAIVEAFEAFLDEKILWIRSNAPVWSVEWGGTVREWRDTLRVWWQVGPAARVGLSVAGVWVMLVLVLAGLLKLFSRRLRRYREELGVQAAKGSARTFTPTLVVLGITLVLALPVSLVVLALWLLFHGVDGLEFPAVDAARACRWTAIFLFLVNFLREVVGRHGLAESHFRWAPSTYRSLRRSSVLAVFVGAPLLWLVLVGGHANGVWLLGRVGLIAGMVLMLLVLWRLFRPSGGLLSPGSGLVLSGMVRGARTMVFLAAVSAPLALGALAASGYYFTAVQLSARLLTTLGLLMALVVLSALITRWRLVTKRSLIVAQRKQQLMAQRQAGEAGQAGEETPAEPSLEQLDVVQVDTQTRKLISTVLVVAAVLGVVAIWAGVFPFLSLREVKLWEVSDGGSISLADLILSLLAVLLTIVAALNLPGFLKLTLFRRMKPGNQYAAATLVQYGIVVVGIVVSFGLIGVGWSKVQWLVAAVSLGLGFGLQEIFANFVSGLILLFEQPIRVGDFITVGDSRGEVTRIRIRATTIRNLDRQELVIPNKEFITGRVVNWTLSDTISRITCHVGIAYGSNVELAHEILLQVARDNPWVVDDPKPKVLFKQFGDSALIFELRIYIATLDDWVKATHTIHTDIDRAFRKAGIEIAFPQRDLHIRSVDRPFPFEMRGSEHPKPDAGKHGA